MNKIIGLGNALVDLLTYLPDDTFLHQHKLPAGSMTLVDAPTAQKLTNEAQRFKQKVMSGGSAANTIYGLAMLNVPCGYMGKVGDDELGRIYKKDLENAGIKAHTIHSSTPTGRALALITPDGERTFAVYLGAALELTSVDLQKEIVNDYDHMHIEGYLVQNHDLMRDALSMAKSMRLTVSLDLASYNVVAENLSFLREIMQQGWVDIVFANEEEAKAFTGRNPEESLEELSAFCPTAVVKIGSKGSFIKTNGKVYRIDAIRAQPIDTTGAGDMYAAGYLCGLTRGYEPEKCGRLASFVAGRCVESEGARMPLNLWAEIQKFMQTL
ncbi:MAG: adenosine kinase [Bacteroidales bacterium]|jgi:sugar/nucleoside kinase (ribokinase family)|nr:adenosine kinase [Bacteroidales bacterium]NPV35879.1 adenosine kinase [Bacteroidales bacterium]